MALSHSPKIVTDGLVLCLDAGDGKSYGGSGTTWTDRSGNGNHGTLTNGPTYSSNNGGSLVFDGSNDYVGYDVDDLFNDTQNFSIEYFIKINNTTSNLLYGHNVNGNRMYSGTYQGYWDIGYGSTTWTSSTDGKQEVTQGWHHIAVTVSDGVCKIYVNSIANSRTITDTSVTYVSGQLYMIGAFNYGSGSTGSFYSGYNHLNNCATFKVYNKALTASEVLQNYNATKGRFS